MRGRLKAGLETAIVQSGLATLLRRRVRSRSLVFAYHGVTPHGESPAGDLALHLSEAQFTAQLEVLGELAKVVPLGDLFAGLESGGRRPRVAITWDDAYAGALTAGVDAVVQRGFPATIFVAPGRLGGKTFWWDRLAAQFAGRIPDSIRARALHQLAGVEEEIAAEYEGQAGPAASLPDFARTASESLLRGVAARPGISVASHSWSHANLAAVSPERLEQELTTSANWLTARFPTYLPCLAYPYGLHSPLVHRRAAATGYTAGFRVDGGWLPRQHGDRFGLPRFNVPAGLSLDGFVVRLSGLLSL